MLTTYFSPSFSFAVCKLLPLFSIWLFLSSCTKEYHQEDTALVQEVQVFIDDYTQNHTKLTLACHQAQNQYKLGNTDSSTIKQALTQLHIFLGNPETVKTANRFFKQKGLLLPLQYTQLSKILYEAVEHVQKNSQDTFVWREALWQERKKAKSSHPSYQELPMRYQQNTNDKARMQIWDILLKGMKSSYDTLDRLVKLRNEDASIAGYTSYYSYRADAYQLSEVEATEWRQAFLLSVRPLFEQLHLWVRYELGQRYNRGLIPQNLPIHWLADLHGYQWELDFQKESLRLNDSLATRSSSNLQQQTERFFKKIGFPSLPLANYLYVRTPKPVKKHAWMSLDATGTPKVYLDLEHSLNSCLDFNHAYALASMAQTYQNPDVPILLQKTAVPAIEQGWAGAVQYQELRWLQEQFLPKDSLRQVQVKRRLLLEEALAVIPRLVFYAGVSSEFERALYAGSMPKTAYNRRWWGLMRRYMGVELPSNELDPYGGVLAYPTLAEAPLSSLDSIIGYGMQYQFANLAFQQEDSVPRAGLLMNKMVYPGASLTWKEIYAQQRLSPPNGEEIMRYFAPLMEWLQNQNEGRKSSLPAWKIEVNE